MPSSETFAAAQFVLSTMASDTSATDTDRHDWAGMSATRNDTMPTVHASACSAQRRRPITPLTLPCRIDDNGHVLKRELDKAQSPQSSRRPRRVALLVTFAAVLVLASPALLPDRRDSFPLSTFPMFSSLIEPVVEIDYAVGLDRDGNDATLDPETIAGTDEIIIAGSILSQAVNAGEVALAPLCEAIATRISSSSRASEIVGVEIRTDRLDAVAHFGGDHSPLTRTPHWTCDVG